jgi:mannitol/fructose-specific phosphotransferase system IIA component (Ntr-type)
MNTLADIPHALAALVIFLVVRTIAGAAAVFIRPAGFVLAFAAGMMLSSFRGMATLPGHTLAAAGFELAAGLLLFSSAFMTFGNGSSTPGKAWTPAALPRMVLVLVLPAVSLIVPLVAGRFFPGTFSAGVVRTGLMLALSLWLSRHDRPPDLLAAAGVWILLEFLFTPATAGMPANTISAGSLPYLLILGSGGLLFGLGRWAGSRKSSPGWNPARDGVIALSAVMVTGFRLAGASWGLAALAAGIAAGLAGRHAYQQETTMPLQTLVFEAGLASSFALGLGMGLADSSIHPAETVIIAGAILGIAALRGLASAGSLHYRERIASLFPASALPLGMVLSLGMDSPAARSMAFGLALAGLAALPFVGSTTAGPGKSRRGRPGWKPLVAVSRRGNAAGILAFAAALADPDQPIRSVCVAAAPGSTGPDASEAEETLVRAVAAGASSGFRILPSMITASSTSDGLARAALERRSDCIVIGWKDTPTPSDPDSRSVVDALVQTAPTNVISVRKPEIFSQAKRLVFVTMAGSMNDDGYREAAAIAVAAWGRSPSGMEAIVIGGVADELATTLGIDHRQIASIPVWRELPETIRQGGAQQPAFFVAAARPDWPGWNPGTERIPQVLEDSFPEAALTVFYLKAPLAAGEGADDETGSAKIAGAGIPHAAATASLETGGAKETSPLDRTPGTESLASWPPIIQVAVQGGRILTAMKEAVLVDAISTLTKSLFPNDRTTASRMSSDFSTVARTEPIELAPGILLLHAHARGIAVPALAIGVNKEGWRLVALDEPVKIVIILVSPVEAGPAAHLEALTQIAKSIRDHGFAQALLDPEQSTTFLPE